MHHKALWPLTKLSNKGFRGYPVATVAFYGSDDRRASKVAVGIVAAEGAEPAALERWFSQERDVRDDTDITTAIVTFLDGHNVKSVVVADQIIGCPHEEGVDYPKVRSVHRVHSGKLATGGPAACCTDSAEAKAADWPLTSTRLGLTVQTEKETP